MTTGHRISTANPDNPEVAHEDSDVNVRAILGFGAGLIVVAYQNIFYFRQWPEPTVWLVAGTYAAGAFILGTTLVLAFEDRFAEQL